MTMDSSKRLPPGQAKSSPRKHPSSTGPSYGGGRSLRSGKPTGRGSREASPSTTPHYQRQASPSHPSQQQQSSPAPAPSLLQSQLQHHTAELMAKTPVSELINRVNKLGFPGSCAFVLSQLDRFLRVSVLGDSSSKGSLAGKDTLLALVDTFVLCEKESSHKSGGRGSKFEVGPQVNPIEEMQLLMSVKTQIEEQQSLELRYCTFDAIFGSVGGSGQLQVTRHEMLTKLTSLALSLESSPLLSCVALWMQSHPTEALSLVRSLYYDYCVLLPDAMEPLLQLASVSPHLANQMAVAFTTLHPFHVVGTTVPGVDPTHLCPPIRLLEIVSHWVKTCPEFLFPTQLLERKTELPLLRSKKSTLHSKSTSPLPGLIQWCVLAPLADVSQRKPNKKSISRKSNRVQSHSHNTEPISADSKNEKTGTTPMDPEMERTLETLVSELHANLLSVILSHPTSFRQHSLTSDNLAVLVAALLSFRQHLWAGGTKGACTSEGGGGVACDDGGGGGMRESVERLAQFLQISLSNGMLVLSPEDVSSIASTLPENRLLNLVVTHHKHRK